MLEREQPLTNLLEMSKCWSEESVARPAVWVRLARGLEDTRGGWADRREGGRKWAS